MTTWWGPGVPIIGPEDLPECAGGVSATRPAPAASLSAAGLAPVASRDLLPCGSAVPRSLSISATVLTAGRSPGSGEALPHGPPAPLRAAAVSCRWSRSGSVPISGHPVDGDVGPHAGGLLASAGTAHVAEMELTPFPGQISRAASAPSAIATSTSRGDTQSPTASTRRPSSRSASASASHASAALHTTTRSMPGIAVSRPV